MDDIKKEKEGQIIDTDQILAENEALRSELARRDREEQTRRQLQQAKEEMGSRYEDFSELFDEIESILHQTPVLLDLTPETRYRIGYLMLKGERALASRGKEPSVDELVAALKRHPEVLRLFVKGKKNVDPLTAFSFKNSAGIRTFSEKAPQNLTEARHAAIRYAKTR